jgi:ABC-type transport system involved in cytochrome c biogenesis permease subunit
MSMLALTYLATQYQLALHRARFLVALAVAAGAQPLIMAAVGARLTGLALGLLGMHLCLAAAMLWLALRRPSERYVGEADGDAIAAGVEEPAPAAPTVA